jgi:hypothetical protein
MNMRSIYECLIRTRKPLVLHMSEPDENLEILTSTSKMCNHCQIEEAEISQESGEFCLHCWQERTNPNL